MSTKINWCDEVWNPITGCSFGCDYCYARKMSYRLAGRFGYPSHVPGQHPFDVTFHRDRLPIPFQWRKPRRIFVNSMGDLFDTAVPVEWLSEVMQIMDRARIHTFMVLTKQASRMMEYLQDVKALGGGNPPSNIWWGVSVEDQATAEERISMLLLTPAANRFVSCEPILGPVNLEKEIHFGDHRPPFSWIDGLNWLIVGGESGSKARPARPEWVRSLKDQARRADVPFMLKSWGGNRPEFTVTDNMNGCRMPRTLDGNEYLEFPK